MRVACRDSVDLCFAYPARRRPATPARQTPAARRRPPARGRTPSAARRSGRGGGRRRAGARGQAPRPRPGARAPAAMEGRGTTREPARTPRSARPDPADLEVFRIEVGRTHGVEPRNILGAIANEAGLDARNIGRIELFDDYSTVELPAGMPKP